MSKVNLPHVRTVTAKRGRRAYLYFDTGKRKPNGGRIEVPLPDPKHPSFGATYARLLGVRNRTTAKASLGISELYDLWTASREFKELAESSQGAYRRYALRVVELLHPAPAAEVEPRDIQAIMDQNAHRPGAANAMLTYAGAMFAWGMKPARGHVKANPTFGIEKYKLGVHEPWPDHILEAALAADDFEVQLAVATLFYTGQRDGDACKLALPPAGVGEWRVTQQKTGWDGVIPVHANLAKLIDKRRAMKVPATTVILVNGAPTNRHGLRRKLQAWVQAHFAEHVVPHGLRANSVCAMLDMGLSYAQVGSITGQSPQTVEQYDRKRKQSNRAHITMQAWERGGNVAKIGG